MSNNEEEIWRDVIDYEEYYEISNLGVVRSKDRVVIRNNYSYIRKGKLLKISVNSHGYQVIGFTRNNKTILKSIHRLVGIHFIDNPNNKEEINHIDGNKLNNKSNNLEWSTSSENSKHAFITGLNNILGRRYEGKGEQNANSKLNEKQVLEIRSKYIPFKYSVAKLSREYNVSQSCITHIINKNSWKNS